MRFEIMEESTVNKGAAQSLRSKELQRGEPLADYQICICMRWSYSKMGIKPLERNRDGEMTFKIVA